MSADLEGRRSLERDAWTSDREDMATFTRGRELEAVRAERRRQQQTDAAVDVQSVRRVQHLLDATTLRGLRERFRRAPAACTPQFPHAHLDGVVGPLALNPAE